MNLRFNREQRRAAAELDIMAEQAWRPNEWPCEGECHGQWSDKALFNLWRPWDLRMLGVSFNQENSRAGFVPVCGPCSDTSHERFYWAREKW